MARLEDWCGKGEKKLFAKDTAGIIHSDADSRHGCGDGVVSTATSALEVRDVSGSSASAVEDPMPKRRMKRPRFDEEVPLRRSSRIAARSRPAGTGAPPGPLPDVITARVEAIHCVSRFGKVIDFMVQPSDLRGECFVAVTSDEEEPPRKKVCADGGITDAVSAGVIVDVDIKIDDLGEPASRDVVIHFDEQRDEVDGRAGWFSSASLKFSKSASSFSSHRANENKDEKRCYVCGTFTLCPLRLKDLDCPHIACSLKCLHRLSPQWIDIKSGLQELERDLAPKSALEER